MNGPRSGFARTDDGLQLYWRAVGEPTAPPMVCCNGIGVSTFFWKYVAHHFRDRFQVILWDYRGHGLSGVPPESPDMDLSIERTAHDLEAVLRAIGTQEPAILLGHSMGCQVILEVARLYPHRVRGLIPMFGTFAKPLDTFMDSPYARSIFNAVDKMVARGGRSGARWLRPLYASPLAFALGRRSGLVDRHYASRQDIEMYLEHLNHMNPLLFFRMLMQIADHDLTDFLPTISVPTLIFAAEKDLFTPLHRSRKMAELIRDAELIVLPEGSHAAIVEQSETINLRIERFLRERLFEQEPRAQASGGQPAPSIRASGQAAPPTRP